MGSQHRHHGPPGADHYNGRPKATLVAQVSGVAPGRAVDLGCGSGADAIWLASLGWSVTAIDISQAAIEGAKRAGRESGVAVNWICADFVAQPPASRSFDLVIALYPALLKSAGRDAIDALSGGVAIGGTLLVVGHSAGAREAARSAGFDPGRYMEPTDIAGYLDPSEWAFQTVPGEETTEARPPSGHDVVLRVRRR